MLEGTGSRLRVFLLVLRVFRRRVQGLKRNGDVNISTVTGSYMGTLQGYFQGSTFPRILQESTSTFWECQGSGFHELVCGFVKVRGRLAQRCWGLGFGVLGDLHSRLAKVWRRLRVVSQQQPRC